MGPANPQLYYSTILLILGILKWPSYHDSKIKINTNQRTLNSRPKRTCTCLFTGNSKKKGIEKREEFGSRGSQENIFGETHLRKRNLGSGDLWDSFWTTYFPTGFQETLRSQVVWLQWNPRRLSCHPHIEWFHPNRHMNEAKQHITNRITYKNTFVRENLLHRLSHNYLANISLLKLLNTTPKVRTISK